MALPPQPIPGKRLLAALVVAVVGCAAGVILRALAPRRPPAEGARPAAWRPPERAEATWSPPDDFGRPINREVAGVVCFRGNAQRNYYGEGPVPQGPVRILWRLPIGADPAEGRWNGVGWTGQPLVVEWPANVRARMNFLRPPGPEAEVVVGALDGRVHFADARTGERSRPPLRVPIPNPIKGTVSIDPRGYPLLYVGCGLPRAKAGFRVFSLLDFRELLWLPGSDRRAPRAWPAFDSNALVLRDHLLLAGENGLFYLARLGARWDAAAGSLRLAPHVTRVPVTPAGIESSLAVWGDHAYAGDTDGNLWRFDLAHGGRAERLRNLGDDADSTVTFDRDGTFYVGIEVDHRGARARGRLYRLRAPGGSVVWRWDFPAESILGKTRLHALNGGVLSTVAVWPEGGLVFVTTAHHPRRYRGALVALDRETGRPRWTRRLRRYAWSSPVVVDGVVVAGDASGAVYVCDAATGRSLLTDAAGAPIEFLDVGATIEGSPLVWRGRIYLGVRGGALLCLGVPDPEGEGAIAG